jgi:hypothetical protein
MRTSLILVFVAALALAAGAAAKGPSAASITGPGIDGSLAIPGNGEGAPDTPLGDLVQNSGFFAGMFGQSPDPMLADRPAGDLGPRFTVTYRVPGPDGSDSRVVQDVYPYATPSPVTYMAPDQPFWSGDRTHGGWYLSSGNLTTDIGLPATTPDTRGGSHVWRWVGVGIAAAALAAMVAAAVLLRRVPRTRPTAA